MSKYQLKMKFGGNFQLAVMDFSDLCWIDFITPSKFDVGFRKVQKGNDFFLRNLEWTLFILILSMLQVRFRYILLMETSSIALLI